MQGKKPAMPRKQALLSGAALEALQNALRATIQAKKCLVAMKGVKVTTKPLRFDPFITKFPPVLPLPTECNFYNPIEQATRDSMRASKITKITEKDIVKALRKIEKWQTCLREIFKEMYLKP